MNGGNFAGLIIFKPHAETIPCIGARTHSTLCPSGGLG